MKNTIRSEELKDMPQLIMLPVFFRNILFTFALIIPCLISLNAEAKPLGYERYSLSGGGGTWLFYEESPKEVYESWAQPFLLTGTSTYGTNNWRLIDIEVNVIGDKGKQQLTLSGIALNNTGQYKQDSWLQTNVSLSDYVDFYQAFHEDLIPVDIERYKLNGELKFAIIWQRNVHKSDWFILFNESVEVVRTNEWLGFRVVEFDELVGLNPDYGTVGDSIFTGEVKYDVIMVRNSGGNYLNSEWTYLVLAFWNSGLKSKDGQYLKVAYHIDSFNNLPEGSIAVDVENFKWYGIIEYNETVIGRAVIVHNVANVCPMEITAFLSLDSQLNIMHSNQDYYGQTIDMEIINQALEDWSTTTTNVWSQIHACKY